MRSVHFGDDTIVFASDCDINMKISDDFPTSISMQISLWLKVINEIHNIYWRIDPEQKEQNIPVQKYFKYFKYWIYLYFGLYHYETPVQVYNYTPTIHYALCVIICSLVCRNVWASIMWFWSSCTRCTVKEHNNNIFHWKTITKYNSPSNKIMIAWCTGWQVIWQQLNQARRVVWLIGQEKSL